MSFASSHSSTPPPSPYYSTGPGLPPIASRRYAPGDAATGADANASLAIRRSAEDARSRQDARTDQITQRLYSKAAQVISSARLTHHESGMPRAPQSREETIVPPRRTEHWFNLELEETRLFKEELRTWKSVTSRLNANGSVPSLVLDVILDTSDLPPSKTLVMPDGHGRASRVGIDRRCPNIVLERWTMDLRQPAPLNPPPLPGVYKQGIILFRALYALMVALPTADLHRRLLRRLGSIATGLRIGCRLSNSDNLAYLPNEEMALGEALTDDAATASVERFPFAPVQTPAGLFHLECSFRKQADFSVQDFETVLSSRFFDEDIFRLHSTVQQRTAAAAPGSMPSGQKMATGSLPVPSRPSYGSLSSRHLLGEKPPTPSTTSTTASTAAVTASETVSSSSGLESGLAEYLSSQEGAFITTSRSRSISIAAQKGKGVESSPTMIPRRPSLGQTHPYKSSPSSGSPLRPSSSASPRDPIPLGSGRLSSGSPSFGPSSSLRYQSPSYFDAATYTPGSTSASASSSRVAVRRYSSRGLYGASSSSGGSGSPAPGLGAQETPGRIRPRHSSMSSRENVFAAVEKPSPQEQEDISAFLNMVDERPHYGSSAASVGISRSAADERLRLLASSVYRAGEPVLLRPRLASRLSIEEESEQRDPATASMSHQLDSDIASGSSGAPAAASSDSFPRYSSTQSRRLSHSRRPSSTTAFDEVEAVGRLELSQEESPSSGAAEMPSTHTSPGPATMMQHPVPNHRSGLSGHRSPRPTSALSSRRESSVDATAESISPTTGGAAHHMQLGRGRGRPGRLQQEREREWEERRQDKEKSASSSIAGSSRASSRASSVGP